MQREKQETAERIEACGGLGVSWWGGEDGWMGAALRSRQRGVKKAAGIKEQGFLAAVTVKVEERRGRVGRVVKMRSNRDLDSKTPRHNRQGLTPREPLHP